METYVYLDEAGKKTASGEIRITESTYRLGLRMKEIIDDWELYEDDDFDLEEAAHKAFYSENL